MKYHFLNCSRQSRLLGRWVKLSNDLGEKWYLDFIPVTKVVKKAWLMEFAEEQM